jgi:hypothetical protein
MASSITPRGKKRKKKTLNGTMALYTILTIDKNIVAINRHVI